MENTTFLAYLLTSLVELQTTTPFNHPLPSNQTTALVNVTVSSNQSLLANSPEIATSPLVSSETSQPRRVYRHRFSGGQRIFRDGSNVRQTAAVPTKNMSRPVKGAIIIGSFFLLLTLSITTAIIIFCKKKNTVFVFQRSDQDDFDEESQGGSTIFDDNDDASSYTSSNYSGKRRRQRRTVEDFSTLELGQLNSVQAIDHFVTSSIGSASYYMEPDETVSASAWNARPWHHQKTSSLPHSDLDTVQVQVHRHNTTQRTISLLEPSPHSPPLHEVAMPTTREYDLPFDERMALTFQTIDEVSDENDDDDDDREEDVQAETDHCEESKVLTKPQPEYSV